jgi:hypothetical protein
LRGAERWSSRPASSESYLALASIDCARAHMPSTAGWPGKGRPAGRAAGATTVGEVLTIVLAHAGDCERNTVYVASKCMRTMLR